MAAMFGFGGIAVEIAKIPFFIFIVVMIVTLTLRLIKR
jgi:uncharacterized membrane protein YtjA (UPF0391 family)